MQSTNYKKQSDIRQYGGMLMLLGFAAVIQPLGGVVGAFGPDGANTTDPSVIPFWGMIGSFCVFICGVVAVLTGYLANTHDWSHRYLSGFLIVIIQTAFIPYITNMTAVGKFARLPAEENVFIPLDYEPTETDVKFVGAMGVMAIFTYGFTFVGGLSFVTFCLHAYNSDKAQDRSGGYFIGRLSFYSGMLALAGLVQMMLGAYCRVRFGLDVLSAGPVGVAMLTVSYPTISVFVGLFQVFMGVWGALRSVGYHKGPNDIGFQLFLGVQWILVLSIQCIAQIGYLPGGEGAAAPTLAAMSLALSVMPAFLDHKMRTLPLQFPSDYYALPVAKALEISTSSESSMVKDSLVNSYDGDDDVQNEVDV